MSTYLNGDEAGLDPRVKTKLAQVQAQPASKIFVFIEEDFASPWLGSFMVLPRERIGATGFVSVPGAWHRQGADLAFADGHVAYWRWFAPRKVSKASVPSLSRSELRDLGRFEDAIPKP